MMIQLELPYDIMIIHLAVSELILIYLKIIPEQFLFYYLTQVLTLMIKLELPYEILIIPLAVSEFTHLLFCPSESS